MLRQSGQPEYAKNGDELICKCYIGNVNDSEFHI